MAISRLGFGVVLLCFAAPRCLGSVSLAVRSRALGVLSSLAPSAFLVLRAQNCLAASLYNPYKPITEPSKSLIGFHATWWSEEALMVRELILTKFGLIQDPQNASGPEG